jgi:hypothetical protein
MTMIAQALDPIADHARAAAESAGLPPWAVTLIAALAPVLALLMREWLARRRGDATVRAMIRGVEAAAETLPAHQARAVKRAIEGAASAAGVEPALQRQVKRETAKMDAERARANGGASAAHPGPARPHPPPREGAA